MKNYILMLIASFVLFGCGAIKKLDSKVSQCYLGMPITELKSLFGKDLELVEINSTRTVYKVDKSLSNDYWSDSIFKYFYFDTNGKLFSIDEGETPPDVSVEIKNK
tara:strand:+ start:241 stop:558 length:318 start_codon:yes stop_codon:yes gene_type:complete